MTISAQVRLGPSPLALVPAVLWDGGQLGHGAVAVQVLGGPPRHDPLQLPVIGFAAFRRGVVRQTASHPLTPQPQLHVSNLKPQQVSLAHWPATLGVLKR